MVKLVDIVFIDKKRSRKFFYTFFNTVVYYDLNIIPVSSFCSSGTTDGAIIMGTDPAIPFVIPRSRENNTAHPTPGKRGKPLGAAHIANRGTKIIRLEDSRRSCFFVQS